MLERTRAQAQEEAPVARAGTGSGKSVTGPPPGSAYSTWYPPLRSTLLVLSKVYRAVDMGVFEDLAQLAVAACAESMKVCLERGVFPARKTFKIDCC